jgi:hypothetical protein
VRRHFVLKGLAMVVLATAVVAALSFVVMSLWNALVPSLFAGPVIGFWQAAGILVLCRILFGGFRGRGGHGWRHRGWHRRWGRMTQEERDRLRDGFARWNDMTREERREFRGSLHGSFHGCGPEPADDLAHPDGSP